METLAVAALVGLSATAGVLAGAALARYVIRRKDRP
jgi:hypothetical protein